jgi:hypothetical protein
MFEISYYYRLRQAFVRVIPSLPAAGRRSQARLPSSSFCSMNLSALAVLDVNRALCDKELRSTKP